MWRDEYNEWKNNHDFTKYKNRDEIDEVIVNKLANMLDEMEKQFTSHNSNYTATADKQPTPKVTS